jgi:formylglycine-generating enzyme required for sulfatase activity
VPFIAMPFLKGEALDRRLKRDGKLPVAEAVRIARETAEGLAAAHERGLIHRDIKPANIWLEASPGRKSGEFRVKIMDFGLARVAEKDDVALTKSGTILGTPAYMAPEQAMANKAVDFRCDLFSLGAVFYHMLTGERPFKGHDTMSLLMALATETPKPVRELNPAVPPAVVDLVQQLLEKDPARRPASAKAVADALAAIEEDQTQVLQTLTRRVSERSRSPSLARRVSVLPFRLVWWLLRIPGRTGLVIKGTLGLLVLVLVLFLLPRGSGPDDGKMAKGTPGTTGKSTEPEKRFKNALGMEFVLVPKGKAWLGGGANDPGTETEMTYDFYLGQYEVTQEEWEKVTGINPSGFKGMPEITGRLPVENVTWDDCQVFVQRVNAQTKETGWVYRLPKEVEWDYACRGGPMTDKFDGAFDFYFDKPFNTLLPDMANFDHGKGLKRTCKVGSYKPNRLGLYDMHGNVWEWCDDIIPGDPKDPKAASQRVARGGSWDSGSGDCRAAHRRVLAPSNRSSNLGLRLARVPVGGKLGQARPHPAQADRRSRSVGGAGAET